MRVLVTGATGYIGRFAVAELLTAGHEVRALVRDHDRAVQLLDRRVELAVGSALDAQAVRTALDGSDALVQAAGVYSYRRREAPRILRETPALARAVLTAAAEARVPQVVDIASTVVFSTNGDRVDATTRLARPGDYTWGDPYVRAKVAAEVFGQEMERRGMPRVTLHPSRVLGPDDAGPGTSGQTVIDLLRGGLTTNARGGWVDVRDVARAVAAGLEAPRGTHAVVSASSATYRELAPLLDGLTGRSVRRVFLPAGVLRPMARLNDAVRGRLLDLPTAGALEYVLTSPPVDGSSATNVLGINYRPLEETLSDAIRWWATNGVIDKRTAGKLA